MFRNKLFLFLFLVSSAFCVQASEAFSLDGATLVTKTLVASSSEERYEVIKGSLMVYRASYYRDNNSYDCVERCVGSMNGANTVTDVPVNTPAKLFFMCKALWATESIPTLLHELK